MLETRAIVVQLDGVEAVVEAAQGGGCGLCASSKGCGSGKMSQLLCVRPRQFRVRNEINARIGEEVQVAVADGVLLRSALTLYGLPLLLLFVGALLGARWMDGISGHDAGSAIGAAVGLLVGFPLAGFLASLQQASFAELPAIVRCANIKNSAIL
jgi:sigma-E factor negative regulatory protein RseC